MSNMLVLVQYIYVNILVNSKFCLFLNPCPQTTVISVKMLIFTAYW